jgi:alcohol dehydrogenase
MKAWRVERLGGALSFGDLPVPEVRAGTALVRIQAVPLLSYFKQYLEGKLTHYNPPQGPFTPGTNGVGVIEAVGRDVWHLKPGQRVVLSPLLAAAENVDDPAQILIGLTAVSVGSEVVLADWRAGTLAEHTLAPVAAVTPAEGLDALGPAQLAVLSRFIVPFGGLLRGRLAAGEILVVNGATGAYGTAAVLLGVAMGASRVVAAGRNESGLSAVARAGGPRVIPVRLSGNQQADATALRAAAGGGAQIAFDMVGQARDPNSTLAALYSLRRAGRLVLMGSMTTPLPLPYTDVMLNDWEIIGQFMYPGHAYRRLMAMVRSGLLDISVIRPVTFPLDALREATERAATAGNFDCVVIQS